MKKLLALLLVLAALFCVFAGCAKTDTTTPSGETQSSDSSADTAAADVAETTDETAQTETSGKKFKIGFSQCTMKHGWRVCMPTATSTGPRKTGRMQRSSSRWR